MKPKRGKGKDVRFPILPTRHFPQRTADDVTRGANIAA